MSKRRWPDVPRDLSGASVGLWPAMTTVVLVLAGLAACARPPAIPDPPDIVEQVRAVDTRSTTAGTDAAARPARPLWTPELAPADAVGPLVAEVLSVPASNLHPHGVVWATAETPAVRLTGDAPRLRSATLPTNFRCHSTECVAIVDGHRWYVRVMRPKLAPPRIVGVFDGGKSGVSVAREAWSETTDEIFVEPIIGDIGDALSSEEGGAWDAGLKSLQRVFLVDQDNPWVTLYASRLLIQRGDVEAAGDRLTELRQSHQAPAVIAQRMAATDAIMAKLSAHPAFVALATEVRAAPPRQPDHFLAWLRRFRFDPAAAKQAAPSVDEDALFRVLQAYLQEAPLLPVGVGEVRWSTGEGIDIKRAADGTLRVVAVVESPGPDPSSDD